jgi:hypothetical protein
MAAMIHLKRLLGVLAAAILGVAALYVSPPLTFTYRLFGTGSAGDSLLPYLAPVLLLAAAGLLARLLFELSPWLLGPSTALAPALVCGLFATGEDAADSRGAGLKIAFVLVAAAAPGTIGACAGELISRWRRRKREVLEGL